MARPQHYRTIQFASPRDGPPDPTVVSSVSHTLLLFFDRLDAALLGRACTETRAAVAEFGAARMAGGRPSWPLAGVVSTVAGAAGQCGSADGRGAAARFYGPCGIAVDCVGNVFVADTENHLIRRVSAAGVVTTVAGAAGQHGSADGRGAAARFNQPYGIAVDGAGNVFVADTFYHLIRRISVAGDVTTVAGAAGRNGSADGRGAAARFSHPRGIAVDGAGNVFVADSFNNIVRRIY